MCIGDQSENSNMIGCFKHNLEINKSIFSQCKPSDKKYQKVSSKHLISFKDIKQK